LLQALGASDRVPGRAGDLGNNASTIKAATNAQQWTFLRGRRGIRIFTPDKEQLR